MGTKHTRVWLFCLCSKSDTWPRIGKCKGMEGTGADCWQLDGWVDINGWHIPKKPTGNSDEGERLFDNHDVIVVSIYICFEIIFASFYHEGHFLSWGSPPAVLTWVTTSSPYLFKQKQKCFTIVVIMLFNNNDVWRKHIIEGGKSRWWQWGGWWWNDAKPLGPDTTNANCGYHFVHKSSPSMQKKQK